VLHGKVGTVALSVLGPKLGKKYLRRDITRVGLASDELVPSLSTLTDDVSGVPIMKVSHFILYAQGRFRHTSCSCTRR
jgi:hypothetical protein